MGIILRVGPTEMAPLRHGRRRSDTASLPHDVISLDLAWGQIWAKSVEKRRSYGIFSVFGGAAGGGPESSLPVVGSAPNFSPKISIPQGCLTKNFSPIGQEMAAKPYVEIGTTNKQTDGQTDTHPPICPNLPIVDCEIFCSRL